MTAEQQSDVTDLRQSVVELAECVKELCRIASGSSDNEFLKKRIEDNYNKATRAKNRVDGWWK